MQTVADEFVNKDSSIKMLAEAMKRDREESEKLMEARQSRFDALEEKKERIELLSEKLANLEADVFLLSLVEPEELSVEDKLELEMKEHDLITLRTKFCAEIRNDSFRWKSQEAE